MREMVNNVMEQVGDQYDRGLRTSYDKEAAQYDRLRYESAEGRFFNDLEIALLGTLLRTGDGTKILDIPAGTGRLSVALSRNNIKIVGADLSLNMLDMAAAKARKHNASGLSFTQASGTQLPFADDTFDAVVSFKFFHLISNDLKRVFIREMARVLKPGGSLVVEFNSPFYGGFLAFIRYYFQKKHPGGMRMKCLFPDQVASLFEGLTVTRTYGVKLPLAGRLQSLVGVERAASLNRWFGRLPGLKYFAYAIVVEARKAN